MMLAAIAVVPAAEGAPRDVQADARALVTDLAAKKFDRVEARFDSTMKAAMPVAKLQAFWTELLTEVGKFKSVTSVRSTTVGDYRVQLVTCAFDKQAVVIKLAYDRAGRVGGLFVLPPEVPWKAPPYAAADAVERPVSVGPHKLPGRFLKPKGAGPFPAVVLVHGSGPTDEDGTVSAVKVFRDLAYGLAAQGIASLRYPKRAAVHPALFAPDRPFTVKEEVTDDVQAALGSLATLGEVDPKRVWLIGHSLGAMLVPRIAARDKRVAGIVVMAGAVRAFEELLLEQVGSVKSRDSAEYKKVQAVTENIRSAALKSTDVIDFGGSKIPGSYFLDLRGYRPSAVAATLEVPVLVLHGGRDFQVPTSEFYLWKKDLAAKPDAKFKLYPALNHLFVSGSGPPSPAEYANPGHVDAQVIADIKQFMTSPEPPR